MKNYSDLNVALFSVGNQDKRLILDFNQYDFTDRCMDFTSYIMEQIPYETRRIKEVYAKFIECYNDNQEVLNLILANFFQEDIEEVLLKYPNINYLQDIDQFKVALMLNTRVKGVFNTNLEQVIKDYSNVEYVTSLGGYLDEYGEIYDSIAHYLVDEFEQEIIEREDSEEYWCTDEYTNDLYLDLESAMSDYGICTDFCIAELTISNLERFNNCLYCVIDNYLYKLTLDKLENENENL